LRRDCLLEHSIEGKIQGRIEVTGRRGRRRKKLRMTLKKREDTVNLKRRRYLALCGERALEVAMDLS
jgi:hypothetical protein